MEKSTDIAIHEVVATVEILLKFKEYTLGIFLDIEVALNNITMAAIKEALVTADITGQVSSWVEKMLGCRPIISECGGASTERSLSRGTPKGEVLSLLFWMLALDDILKTPENEGVKVVAYADDVVILTSGKFLDVISEAAEIALRKVCKWAKPKVYLLIHRKPRWRCSRNTEFLCGRWQLKIKPICQG